ncbi:hypothetical protein DFH28DRAFT_1120496 [Melampsora americana]|nr:hypothetical protein DFH28DRAFT_1120496 [Melampsora americana]
MSSSSSPLSHFFNQSHPYSINTISIFDGFRTLALIFRSPLNRFQALPFLITISKAEFRLGPSSSMHLDSFSSIPISQLSTIDSNLYLHSVFYFNFDL